VTLNKTIQDELEPSFEKSGERLLRAGMLSYISVKESHQECRGVQIKRLGLGFVRVGKESNRHEKRHLFLGSHSKLIGSSSHGLIR